MTEHRKIIWTEAFEIGVTRIDFEHQIFADLINTLADKIAAQKDALSISRTLQEIIKYADFHFTSEENIMEECGYPGLKEHIDIHRALQSALSDRVLAMVSGTDTASDVVNFLVDWFISHTMHEDARISLYCQALPERSR